MDPTVPLGFGLGLVRRRKERILGLEQSFEGSRPGFFHVVVVF